MSEEKDGLDHSLVKSTSSRMEQGKSNALQTKEQTKRKFQPIRK